MAGRKLLGHDETETHQARLNRAALIAPEPSKFSAFNKEFVCINYE